MTTQYVSSGITGSGVAVSSGNALEILSGGTADVTVVSSGGLLQVDAGGFASSTQMPLWGSETVFGLDTAAQVGALATLSVSSGGTASGAAVNGNGQALVFSGGTTISTTVNIGGSQIVSSGGSASGTTINPGGIEFVRFGGTTIQTKVNSFGDLLDQGSSINTIVVSYGTESVYPGASASGTTVYSDGLQAVSGLANSTTVSSGGSEVVFAGGTAIDTTILSGGTVTVSSGGTLELLGANTVSGVTVQAGGILEIGSGNTLSGYAVSSGVTLVVASGGTTIATTVSSGGVEVISSGGVASGTVISAGGSATISNAGVMFLQGSASHIVINSGGNLILEPGGTVSHVVNNGTIQFAGGGEGHMGVASGTGVVEVTNGGTLNLSLTSSTSNFTGDFVISGGAILELTSAGAALGLPINLADANTILRIDDTVMPSDVISGFVTGARWIFLADTSFNSSGSAQALSGNVLQVIEGATTDDLQLDPSRNYAGQAFVLLPHGGGGTLVGIGQVVTVSSGQGISGTTINSGIIEEIFGSAVSTNVAAGGTQVVFFGGTASGTALSGGLELLYGSDTNATVGSGGKLQVEAGGTASGATIDSGGREVVFSGGNDVGARVNDGGRMTVDSGGTTTSVSLAGSDGSGGREILSGGTAYFTTLSASAILIVSSGGIAIGAIVNSKTSPSNGGMIVSAGGQASGTTINSGGVEVVLSGGLTSNTTVSSGGTLTVSSGGLADPATVYGGGRETVSAGGIDDGAILSGGEQDVYGTASGTVVNSGGMQVVGSGGTASATTINGGGTATVLDGGTLAGNTANNGTLIFDLIGSAGFAGTVTGSGPLVVEGGGALDVLTAYAGAATIDAGSKLEFALPYNGGAATFNGPSAVLQFDQASSPGYVLVSDTSDQIVAAPGSNVTVYSNANFTLPSNVDTLKLAGGATVATGNSDAAGDALWANPSAASTLIGNSAHDVFVVFNAGDTVSGLPGANDTVYAATDYTLADNVHVDTIKLIGSAIHATGNHDSAGDQIWANPTQVSTLTGESGNDLFIVFNSPDQVSDAAAGNNVVLSFADYTLPDSVNVDVLKLAGSAAHATGNHDASGDQLWANPNVASTLTGESLNDVFVVFNPGDQVIGQPGSNDTVYSLVDYTLPANVDTLKIVGPTASHATGNSDAAGDQLWSNPGVNSTLTGNSQNDVFVVFNTGDHVTGQAGANDTVYAAANFTLPDNVNVDTLKLIGSTTHATGNHDSHGDQLWANPNFTSTLTGESGNDVFLAYHSGDTVSGQAGNNTVYAAADFTLPTGVHIDNLKLIGSASHGTANNEGDTLWGNSDPNIASTLNGGATGTDAFLVTGSGGSTINAGAGTDTFDFLPASIGNGNTINGFDTGKDVIVFNHVLFANYAAVHGAMSQVGANTVITHDANNAVALDNVNMNNLTAGNFQFS